MARVGVFMAFSFPWRVNRQPPNPVGMHSGTAFQRAQRELDAYFDKTLERFTVPYSLTGTAFQLSVWRALGSIPYGSVVSYGEIASRVGKPKGAQAVGMANHTNPLPIIIPLP